MNLTIISGGQTGVDRGAFWGARDIGLPRKGYMPRDERDEQGPIPQDIASELWRCTIDGYKARTGANVQVAHAVLLVVQNAQKPDATAGTRLTIACAKRRMLPILAVDADVFVKSRQLVYEWLVDMTEVYDDDPEAPEPETWLLVAGPRKSIWAGGEDIARAWVRTIRGAD